MSTDPTSQIHPLKFFAVLKWLDGRDLLPLLPPTWIEILNEVFDTQPDGLLKYRRVLTMMSKKNLKSLIAMLLALYFCMVWKAQGSKGNQVYVLANDKGQAADDLTLLKKLVRVNPVLLAELTIKGDEVVRNDGQGFIEVLPAGDAIGMHGKSYLLAIFDEIHGMKTYDVLTAMELDRSRPDALQWFCSYASLYRHSGVPIVDMLKQHEAGTDPRLYVRNFTGSIDAANPAMDTPLGGTRTAILEAQRALPSWVWRRLYLNEPGQPDGAAFDANKVEDTIMKGCPGLPPHPGRSYVAFCDLSGGGDDDATLAIAHDEDGVAVLDCLVDQGARIHRTFSPADSVKKFADVLKQYGLSSVVGDRYAAQWPVEAYAVHDISYRPAELNRSQVYAAFEPLLNSGRVRLVDHPKLLQQFIGLIRKGEKIDHVAGEHDDHCNSVAGAVVLAAQHASQVPLMFFSGGRLLSSAVDAVTRVMQARSTPTQVVTPVNGKPTAPVRVRTIAEIESLDEGCRSPDEQARLDQHYVHVKRTRVPSDFEQYLASGGVWFPNDEIPRSELGQVMDAISAKFARWR